MKKSSGMTKKQRKFIRSLHQKKRREQEGLFLVEGAKNVLELLQTPRFDVAELFATSAFQDQNAALLSEYSPVTASPNDLQQAGTFRSNDQALALVRIPAETPPPALSGLVLALDDISDPGNFGTMLRIADWYAASAVLCSPQTVELYNPKVIAASMGSFLRINVHRLALPDYLRESPLPVWGMFMEGQSLHQATLPEELVVVIGNESHGISAPVQKVVHQAVTIPRFGAAESLNAGIATAVFCDHYRRGNALG